jgi:ABC-type nitrate/sulfonate/bicarbonate transport system substrate-binding protein/predicted transcriptional regulator
VVVVRTKRFWRLDDDDRRTINQLAAGLGRNPAQVLAYLTLRADREDDPATGLEIRIGTDLNWNTVSDALEQLEDYGLLSRTILSDNSHGRPPKAWYPAADLDTIAHRAYDRHAAALLRRADALHRDGNVVDTGEATTTQVDRQTETEHTVTLGLNWRPNGLHVPFYAAKLGDHYEDCGVAVQFDHEEGSRRAVKRVVDGDADLGVAGAATVVRAREADEPVYPIAVVYQRAMAVFYTIRETFGEQLERVAQFHDRRIGMPKHSETGLLGRLFLSQLDIDERRFIDTAGEERETLLSDDADIVTGSFSDPHELEVQEFTVDVIPVADRFPIYGLTLVARPDVLADRRTTLRRFLTGTIHGWVQARLCPDEAVEAIAAEDDASPSRVEWTFERAVEEFSESDAVDEHGWGWQRADIWDRLRTALAQGGLLCGDA